MVDCVCMPMCFKHDAPRPCPICDIEIEKEWDKFARKIEKEGYNKEG